MGIRRGFRRAQYHVFRGCRTRARNRHHAGLGFRRARVVFSFLIEALLISFVGGALGCLAVLPLNGYTTGAMNWQTFSHLAFAFRVTPLLLAMGIIFALAMGLIGGVPPAVRAASRPVAQALREL